MAAPSAASQSRSAVGNVRAQRAADRAHNEAVIASTDEQVAQALADEEAQVSPSQSVAFLAPGAQLPYFGSAAPRCSACGKVGLAFANSFVLYSY